MNSIQPNNYCSDVITGTDPGTGNAITEWYQTYCANKPSKACMVRSRLFFGSGSGTR
jgi:hypothetical protein